MTRRSATGAAVREEQPTGVGARGDGPEQVSRWGTRGRPVRPARAARSPSAASRGGITIITGLIAAVIGAAVVTASELAIFGNQIGNSKRETGLFGGTPREQLHQRRRGGDADPDGHRGGRGDTDADADRRGDADADAVGHA